MRNLLPKIFLASAMVATAALATNVALAETMVKVPFNFEANGKICPAGVYTVDHNLMSGEVTLRNTDWSRAFAWIAGPGDPSPRDGRVILRFDKQDQHYTLQSVQVGSSITARLDGKKKPLEYKPTQVVLGQ